MQRLVMTGLVVLALCACGREAEPAADPRQAADAAAPGDLQVPAVDAAPVTLEDSMERDPRYIIGISYPPVARKYPGLARLLKQYADAARDELLQAVADLGSEPPTAPYDLALAFTEVVATPRLVTVAADGSSYTGGAHGMPLLARFTWLPERGERLTAAGLIPGRAGWEMVSAVAREQLATALAQRIDGADYTPGERAQALAGGLQMIDQGTAPDAANFDQFEPVVDGAGRITAVRFVFPPYQVGPYSDGVQSVKVPAAVLLPVVAPGYRGLFQGG